MGLPREGRVCRLPNSDIILNYFTTLYLLSLSLFLSLFLYLISISLTNILFQFQESNPGSSAASSDDDTGLSSSNNNNKNHHSTSSTSSSNEAVNATMTTIGPSDHRTIGAGNVDPVKPDLLGDIVQGRNSPNVYIILTKPCQRVMQIDSYCHLFA
jgi:hypothetical protein